MSASDNKNLDILLAANADVLTDQDAEYLRQLDVSSIEISTRTDRKILRRIRQQEHRLDFGAIYKACRRIVAVFMLICTILFGVCMSVEAIRIQVFETAVEWFNEYISIIHWFDPESQARINDYREPELQLAGTERTVIAATDEYYLIYYTKNNNRQVTYQQSIKADNEIRRDNDDCVVEDVYIKDTQAVYIRYKDGKSILTWHDELYAYTLSGYHEDVSLDTLIAIASSIK